MLYCGLSQLCGTALLVNTLCCLLSCIAGLAQGLQQGPVVAGRRGGLMTPGGSDLTAVASRNADKLQLLSSMPPPGDPEALDEFLAKFVCTTSQVGGLVLCYITLHTLGWTGDPVTVTEHVT
jgi:hypothetical protein